MEKNTIIAVVLSTLILLVWVRLNPPQQPAYMQAQNQAGSPVGNVVEDKTAAPAERAVGEERVTVHTARSIVEFSSIGGGIDHWFIKEREKEKATMPDMIALKGGMLPVKLDIGNIETLADKNFTLKGLKGKEIVLKEGEDVSVQFDYLTDKGLLVSKSYRLSYDGPVHDVEVKLSNKSGDVLDIKGVKMTWPAGLGITAEGITARQQKTAQKLARENRLKYFTMADGKLRRKLTKKRFLWFIFDRELKSVDKQFNSIAWTGIANRYFAAAMINRNNMKNFCAQEIKTGPMRVWQPGLRHDSFILKNNEAKTIELGLFVGLKDRARIEQAGAGLEKIMVFGGSFINPISQFFLKLLKYFYSKVHSYGIAIILLSCVFQLMTYPLQRKSYQAQQKMKKVQPLMKEIQAKYKNDPKRLNVEMMNLYKSKGASPFGGCLPMIPQIPIFFALFSMLREAVELRYAEFLWVADLSMKDPYYVFPVLMGVSMFFQQKISGPMGDPAQSKMMMFMPIMFTFMFMSFPAGLTLYWLSNNLFTLAQHLVHNAREKKKTELAVP